jgi:hypothetical protein
MSRSLDYLKGPDKPRPLSLPPASSPYKDLLTRLEQGLSALTGGARDLPARQQTLRGAIAWSYDLLSCKEQALFRRLSVFVDGWSIEAAEVVCHAAGELEAEGHFMLLCQTSLPFLLTHTRIKPFSIRLLIETCGDVPQALKSL